MIRALALLLFAFVPLFAQNGIAEQYNAIYSDEAEQGTFNHAPNAFLVEFAKTLKPGRALDVGMGQGRNTIYLAQQGWQVTGFDLSETGVKLAREQAAKLQVRVTAVVAPTISAKPDGTSSCFLMFHQAIWPNASSGD